MSNPYDHLEIVTTDNTDDHHNPHGCVHCYEVGAGYIETEEGPLVCKRCGGSVLLGLNQAYDYIAYLHRLYGVDD